MRTLSQRIEDLAVCLCSQISEDGNGDVCFCGVMPGSEIAMDYVNGCDDDGPCGMAYVNLTTAQPSSGIGVPNVEVNNCGSMLGFSVEIGILRCAAMGGTNGEPPTQEELTRVSLITFADIKTMMRAVACCNPKPYVLGDYQPYGPNGFVVGGTFDLIMLEE